MSKNYDVVILGAGAAGLMCAIEAAKRKRQVLVIDHANKPGKKILMSGGGRCNFTNLHTSPDKYISHNPHFCKSALSRYTPWHFIELINKYRIAYHEKHLGQLFCDEKSKDVVDLLLAECQKYGVSIQLGQSITEVHQRAENQFTLVAINAVHYQCESLVIATGGLSIPTMGASGFGYNIAKQFEMPVHPTRAGLVPLTLHKQDVERFASLSGVSQDICAMVNKQSFKESMLFTHRGLSGPAILQISSYWKAGEAVVINLCPHYSIAQLIENTLKISGNQSLKTFLRHLLSKRLVSILWSADFLDKSLKSLSSKEIAALEKSVHAWEIVPNGTEGYRTAEVTLGGVDCNAVSSKNFEANAVKGLYFIGEVLDVTGWLGGYNFQWAWASGWSAGQFV
ncbi:NAD(P)/FAD-dependent oxidoreductase [Candidatus Berkiella cookevillensis]|nr:NAD(P)/FAD-dependent oxidoreductase [Candidatus Berkiella cookevillensis]MCS5708447.1 NAD(P)/FAD-dependent oxidoreductase [Candidatus Berkiella cookevillensis]